MSKDEEELPLYHVEDSDKEINYYTSKTKYKYKPKKPSKNKKTKYQFDDEDESDHDNKKLKPLKKIYSENKYISPIKKFFSTLFNCEHLKVVYLFFLLIAVEIGEYFIDSFIDLFPIKFSISILFIIPYIVITLDNEIFFQLNSAFELNFLIHFKFIFLFNKNLNFIEIILITLCGTIFESIFIKKMHVSQYYYSLDGKINKKQYKIYIFESEIYLIIAAFVCNFSFLLYLLKNKKLCFYLYDNIFTGFGDDYQVIYFILLQYLFVRKFIKYLFKYVFIYSDNYKRKEKAFIINIIFLFLYYLYF